tara:strand:+ start:30 stop:1058 length:1029 start_codon:yes stop_codon:yes gene_type:complete
MPMQQVEYEFPDPDKEGGTEIEVEGSAAEFDLEVEGAVGREVVSTPGAKDAEKKEFEIEVVDDTPEKDRGKTPSNFKEVDDEELDSYSKTVKKRIGQLNKAIHDERRAKESAEREREELANIARPLFEENQKLKGTVEKTQTTLLEQAKHTVKTEVESAKRQYKTAYESGDSDAIVLAQEAMTTAKIRADKVNSFKAPALQPPENNIKVPDNTPQRVPQRDQRADTWAKDNSWFGSDDEMTAFALGLDTKLKKNGVNPRSDEYYEKIDSRMRELFPEQFDDGVGNEPAEGRKKSSNVVAPATRSTSPRKVTLSQTQVALAKRLGVSLEDYAKQAAVLMRKQD